MKSELKKVKIVVPVIIVLIMIILLVTYAVDSRFDPQTFFATTILIDEEAYGSNTFDSSQLKLRPIIDQKVEEASNSVIHIAFNVGGSKKNNAQNIVYDIALADLKVDCDLLSPYLKWKLIKNDQETFEGSFDYRFDTIDNGRLVLTTIQQDLVAYNQDKNVYDHYDFYIWLSDSCQNEDIQSCTEAENQSNLFNKKISGKIEVELYAETKKSLVRKPSDIKNINTCIVEENVQDE